MSTISENVVPCTTLR